MRTSHIEEEDAFARTLVIGKTFFLTKLLLSRFRPKIRPTISPKYPSKSTRIKEEYQSKKWHSLSIALNDTLSVLHSSRYQSIIWQISATGDQQEKTNKMAKDSLAKRANADQGRLTESSSLYGGQLDGAKN